MILCWASLGRRTGLSWLRPVERSSKHQGTMLIQFANRQRLDSGSHGHLEIVCVAVVEYRPIDLDHSCRETYGGYEGRV